MSKQNDGAKTQGDPANENALGDAGKKALDAERQARKAAEKQTADLQARLDALEAEKLTDLQKAQKLAADAEAARAELETKLKAKDLDVLKHKIGAELKLPAEIIDRLQGDDEESIRADAEALTKFVSASPQSNFPKPDPSLGAGSGGGGSLTADHAMVRQLFGHSK